MDIKNSQLIRTIQSIYYLPEELLYLILDIVKIYEFPSRYKLIKQESLARRIYFVKKGHLEVIILGMVLRSQLGLLSKITLQLHSIALFLESQVLRLLSYLKIVFFMD